MAEEAATANGNITSIGGETADTRGFVYGTASQSDPGNVAPAATAYTNYLTTAGSYSTGAFTGSLTRIPPDVQVLHGATRR